MIEAIENNNLELLKQLLVTGSVDSDEDLAEAWSTACVEGTVDCVRVMLDAKVDVNFTGQGSQTGAHAATVRGRLDVLGLLIERGINLDLQDDFTGATALHCALSFRNLECVKVGAVVFWRRRRLFFPYL